MCAVEDLVRDVAVALDQERRLLAYTVEAENFEAIHNHSAFTRVMRRSPGTTPAQFRSIQTWASRVEDVTVRTIRSGLEKGARNQRGTSEGAVRCMYSRGEHSRILKQERR